MRPLAAAVAYEARSFPLAIRITLPDDEWAGAQWTRTSHGQPAVGWASLGKLPLESPRGLVSMETAFGPTPSVAAILARLRSRRQGVTLGKARRVALAGFTGQEMDGRVVGSSGHVFAPFSPIRDGAASPDAHVLDTGESFRVTVLDVRGRRVVLFLESVKLRPKAFQAFLATANHVLDQSLEFPA